MVSSMERLGLPDFTLADDATMERYFPSLDGRWSTQTKALVAALGAKGLELNKSWAERPVNWSCPICQRSKPEIARLTPSGLLLCQLDWHHDHLGDCGGAILWRGQTKHADQVRRDALSSAIQVCRPLAERFSTILVCNDCNAADGAAKLELAGLIHPDFSFAPSEVARFIRVAPNRPHEVDLGVARAIWLEAADDVADRLAFMEVLARRIAEDRHSQEAAGFQPHVGLTMLTDVLRADARMRSSVEGLADAVQTRSIQRDGFASSLKRSSRKSAATPTPADLAEFSANLRPTDFWHAPPPDWQCAACDRSRFEMLRRAPKSGLWTAGAHRRRLFVPETCADALRWRHGWSDGGLTYGDHHWAWICKDCRQIVTDTKQTGQNLIDDCLSVADVRTLLITVQPHERPVYDRRAAAQRALDNAEITDAIAEYDDHRRRCLGLFFQRRHLRRTNGDADVEQFQLVSVSEDFTNEDGHLALLRWLIGEGERYAQADARDRRPPAGPEAARSA